MKEENNLYVSLHTNNFHSYTLYWVSLHVLIMKKSNQFYFETRN